MYILDENSPVHPYNIFCRNEKGGGKFTQHEESHIVDMKHKCRSEISGRTFEHEA